MPFLAVEHEGWGVDTFRFPAPRIFRLPFGPELRRKRIAPAEAVPVIDMERDWHDVLPKARLILQLAHPLLGRRATAAAFRCVEFQEMGARGFAFENDFTGVGGKRCHHCHQNKSAWDHRKTYGAKIDCASFAISAQTMTR